MTHLTRCYMGFLAAAVAAVFAMPAAATQWEWNFPNSATTSAQCNGGTITCEFSFSSTAGLPSQTLKVHAYSTPGPAVASTATAPTTGKWINATISNFGGAFGISNTVSGDTNEGPPGSAPEHAVDNAQVYDIMVFELPQGKVWDIEAFRLGWARENNLGNSADIQAWFGGSANSSIDFTQVCFTADAGCTNTLTGTQGFKDVTKWMMGVGAPGDNNVPENQTVFFNQGTADTQNGRYLVMTGALGQKLDAFKPEFIKANGTNGTTTAPLPGTLALLGLGLVGLASVRRRRPTAV